MLKCVFGLLKKNSHVQVTKETSVLVICFQSSGLVSTKVRNFSCPKLLPIQTLGKTAFFPFGLVNPEGFLRVWGKSCSQEELFSYKTISTPILSQCFKNQYTNVSCVIAYFTLSLPFLQLNSIGIP